MKRSNATLLAGLLALSPALQALPEGPNVQAGSVQSQVIPGMMTIQQQTDRAIINWNSFSIGSNELVRVLQPNQAAILLNRVVGQDPSVILGQLQANGNLWLLNPNGILFGPGSRVDVGGLLATTLNIHDSDFMAGRFNFTQLANKPLASVINQGELTVTPQGYLILSAPLVSNEGLIVANLGKVGLISGEQMSLSFDSQGLINYRLTAAQQTPGPVLLTPAMVSDVLRGVVQSGEIAEGTLLTQEDGRVMLTHGSGVTVNSGQIVAPGASVTLDSTQETLLRPGSLISVAGNPASPDAGDIRVLSQGVTWAQPNSRLDASSNVGNGGFVEVSGQTIAVASQVDVRGSERAGDFLIDPDFLHIIAGTNSTGTLDDINPILAGTAPGTNSTVSAGYLQDIVGGNVHLEALDSVFIESDITMQNSVSLNITAVSGNVTWSDPNWVVQTTDAPLNITAGDSINLGIVRANNAIVDLRAPNNITGLTVSPGNVNVSGNQLAVVAGDTGNVNLTSSVDLLRFIQAGNFTVHNNVPLTVQTVNVTEDLTIHNQVDLSTSFSSRDAGNNITVNVTGNVNLSNFDTAFNATTVSVLATGNIAPTGFPDFDLIRSTNLALSAGGTLSPDISFSATNIALSAGVGDIDYFIPGTANIVSLSGVQGVQAPGSVQLDALGDMVLEAPVSGTWVTLFASGDIVQSGAGTRVQADRLTASASGSVGSAATPLQVDVAQLEVEALSGNVHISDGAVTNTRPNLQMDDYSLFVAMDASGVGNVSTVGNLTISNAVFASDVALSATNNIALDLVNNGEGFEPAVSTFGTMLLDAGGDLLGPGFVQGGQQTARAGGNLTLDSGFADQISAQAGGEVFINHFGATTLTGVNSSSGNVVVSNLGSLTIGGNVTAANNLDIEVTANPQNPPTLMTLSGGNVVAGNVANVSVEGALTSAPGFQIQGAQVALSASSINPLTVQTPLLAAQSFSDLNLFANGDVTVGNVGLLTGLQANNISLSSSGNQSINSTVSGDRISLNANNGLLDVTGPVTANTLVDLQAGNGSISLQPASITSLHAVVNASQNIVGVGPGSQLTAENVSLNSDSGSITGVQLSASGNKGIDLEVHAGTSAQVSAVNSVQLVGTPSAGTDLQLAVDGNLTVSSTLTAGNTVALNVTGELVNSGALPMVSANAFSLRTGNVTGAPLSTNVSLLAIQHGDNPLTIEQTTTPLTIAAVNGVSGVNTSGRLDLTTQGALDVLAPVNASTVNVSVANGSLNINSPGGGLQGPDVQVQVVNGNVTLVGPAVIAPLAVLNANGDITGSGAAPNFQVDQLTVNSSAGSAVFSSGSLLLPQTTLAVSALNNVNVTSTNSVETTLASAATGDLNLNVTGNLTRQAGHYQAANQVGLNVTGTLINPNPGLFAQGQALALRAGTISGPPLATNVSALAAQTGGGLNLTNQGPNLTVATLGSLSGVNASDVDLDTVGNLVVASPLRASNLMDVNASNDFTITTGNVVAGGQAFVTAGNNLTGTGAGPHVLAPLVGLGANQIDALTISTPALNAFANNSMNVSAVGDVNVSAVASNNVALTSTGNVTVSSAVSGDNVTLTGSSLNVTGSVTGNVSATLQANAGTVDLGGNALTSPNASIHATANVSGVGAGPHIVSNNVTLHSDSGALNNVHIAGGVGSPVLLAFDAGTSAQVRASHFSVVVSGNSTAGTDMDLSVQGNLTLNNSLSAGNTMAVNVSGDLTNAAVAPGFQANALSVRSGNVTGGPLTTNVSLLAAQSGGSLDLSQITATPLTVTTVNGVSGINASGPVNLTTQGPLTLNASINSPHAAVNASGDITGLGAGPHLVSNNVSLQGNALNNVQLAAAVASPIDLSFTAATSAQISAANSVNLSGGSSVGSDLQLAVTGNLALSNPLVAGNTLALNVTGDLANAGGVPSFQANALSLRTGSLSGAPITTNVSLLAAQSGGSLNLSQTTATPLTVTAVNGVTGINASGPVNLTTQGPLALNSSITSPNAAVNATGNITGLGAGPHVVSNNVSLQGDALNNVQLAAGLAAPIDLAFTAASSAQISAANSVNLSGSSSVGSDLQLAVTGNLALSNNLAVGNLLAVNVTGDLSNPGGSPSFQANALQLSAGNFTGAPVTTNVSLLSAQSGGDLNLSQITPTPLTVTTVNGSTGINAVGNVNLSTQGPLTINSGVNGSNVNVTVASGDLGLNAPLQGAGNVNATVTSGNLAITGLGASAPNATLIASGNISGAGAAPNVRTDQLVASGNDVQLAAAALSQPQIDLNLSALNNLNLTSSNSVLLSSASAANVDLAVSGNLTRAGTILAADQIAVNVTGTLLNPAPGLLAQGQSLALRTGDVSGLPLSTNVSLLAAQSGGSLNLTNTGPNLLVGSVGGLSGLNPANELGLNSAGNLTVADPLVSTSRITVNATGNLTGLGPGPHAVAPEVGLSANAIGPFTVSTATLAATASTDMILLSSGDVAVGTVGALSGLQAGGNVSLTSPGAISVAAPITAPNATLNASGNISGAGGTIVSNNVSLNGDALNNVQLAAGLAAPIDLAFTAASSAQISAANSVNLSGSSSVGSDLQLAVTGNLALSNPLVAGNTLALNITGDLANAGGVPSFQANALSLRTGSLSGAPITTNVSLLAAQNGGPLNLSQTTATPLTVTAVNGVTGINASGPVNLTTQGPLTLAASIQSPHAAVNASGNISGLGAGPHVVSNNVSLNGDALNNVQLAAGLAAPIDLAFTAASSAQISAANSVNLNGSSSVGTDMQLAVQGNLTLSNNLAVGNLLAVNVTGDLSNAGGAPSFQANALQLSAGNFTGAPLTTNVSLLSAQSGGDLNLSQITATPLTVTTVNGSTGINAVGNVHLNTQGPLTVNAGVNGSNVNVSVASGDLALNAPLQGAGNVNATVTSGNLAITGLGVSAPNATLIASGNISGAGAAPNLRTDQLVASGNDVQLAAAALSQPQIDLNLSALNNLNLTSSNSVVLSSASAGNVDLAVTGNFTRAGTILAANQIAVNVTGTVLNPAPGLFAQGQSLALRTGDVSGLPLGTNVSLLAAQSSGSLNLTNSGPNLVVGNVAGLSGVNATDLDLNSAGNLTVSDPLRASNRASINATNNLTGLGPGPHAIAPQLGLSANAIGPFTVSTATLAATANTNMLLSATGNLAVGTVGARSGLQAGGNLSLTTPGNLAVNAPVNGNNVSLTGASLDVTAPVNSSTLANLQASAGGVNLNGTVLTAPNATVTASGDITGLGVAPQIVSNNVSLQGNALNNVQLAAALASPIDLSFTAATSAQISAANSVNLSGSSSVGSDLQLAVDGNLALSNPLVAGNTLALNVTGDLANAGGVPSFQANALSLRTGSLSGAPITTNVSLLAAQNGGSLNLAQTTTTPLTVTAVNGVTGINASGPVNLTTQGPLTLAAPISSPTAAVNASGSINGVGVGPQIVSNNLTLSSQTGSITGVQLGSPNASPVNLTVSAPGNVDLSATNSLILNGTPGVGGNLGLATAGNLALTNTIQVGNLSLSVGGDLLASGAPADIQADNLQLTTGGSVGASAAPLRLTGPTAIAGQAGGDIHLVSDANLTVTTVNGSAGLLAGPSANLNLNLTQGDLNLLQPLGTAGGTVNVSVEQGSITGTGPLRANNAVLQSQGAINVSTEVGGLAAISSTNSVTILESNGLSPISLGNVTGINGTSVNITLTSGDLDLSSPSLGNNSAIVAAQRIDLTALDGNIIGLNPVTRADVRAPMVNFVASGSVGSSEVPIRVALGNQFATTTPGFVQQFPLPPAPPAPPPTPDPALLEPLIVRIPVDTTALGIPVGSFPILLLEPVGSTPGAPKGLWRVSWEIPPNPSAGPEPLRYPYLLDLTLDQLMDQPLTSGFVLMTLEQLLDEPTINPFLEKQLEELMAASLAGPVPGPGPGDPPLNPGLVQKLKLTLDQLLDEPIVNPYLEKKLDELLTLDISVNDGTAFASQSGLVQKLQLTLEQLMDEPVINPFLEKQLEELLDELLQESATSSVSKRR